MTEKDINLDIDEEAHYDYVLRSDRVWGNEEQGYWIDRRTGERSLPPHERQIIELERNRQASEQALATEQFFRTIKDIFLLRWLRKR